MLQPKELKMIKAYPVWRISAKYNNKDYQGNGIHFRWSFRRKFGEETIKARARTWWERYSREKYPNETVELLSLDVEYLGDFTWCLDWFCSKSLNYFSNEADAFASFQDYLDERGFREIDFSLYKDKNGVQECLMGAQDRWRWKYCGCKICKREKITIIQH